jgi:hypothetical protein
MRNLKYLFAFIGSFSIFLSSCDVIEEPFMDLQQEVSDSCEAFIFTPLTNNPTRKVLLEDYTGHKCGNCPLAAEEAKELKEIYGDQLVPVAIHAGFFARTKEPHFITDFTTDAGDDWDTHFGNSAAGNPNGMVNRIGYPESDHILQPSQWAQMVEEQVQLPATIGLQLMASYNETTNLICVDVQTEILQSISAPLSLNIIFTESGIIAYQTDYTADPQEIPDYEHNHVMRKSLTGAWGQSLGQENYAIGDYLVNRYSTEIDETWNVNNMSVVAFVSNTDTYEVLQVEEIHITE